MYLPAMQIMRMRALRAANGGVQEGRRKKAECRMKSRAAQLPRLRGRVESEVGAEMGVVECGNVRLCSLMFAGVRLCSLYWRKMFEAADGERSSILQNARQREMGTRGTRPSEYQRQRLARTCLDFSRAGWMRGKAERMNGKAKGLRDRNTFLTCFTGEHRLGLEENLRLFSLIFA